MKDFLNWVSDNGGFFVVLVEIGTGLAVLVTMVKCAAS